MKVVRRSLRLGITPRLPWLVPWLVLVAGLVLATMPAWRPLIFGVTLTLDDLLNLRCLPG